VVATQWRALTRAVATKDPVSTDNRRTLIACSGGADSSALAIVLAAALSAEDAAHRLVIAHIVHDLRPAREALADRDATARLADFLGVPFVEGSAAIRGLPGNAEAIARRLRYATLTTLASAHSCGWVATAHHADDQLETMLMALIRGTGLRGLAGIHRSRKTGRSSVGTPETPGATGTPTISIIRPMLGVTRRDAETICTRAGWRWQVDATNSDRSRVRASLRASVLPLIESIRPGASLRAASTARMLGDAHSLLRSEARAILRARELNNNEAKPPYRWTRDTLRHVPAYVLSEMLVEATKALSKGHGLDQIHARCINDAANAIRARSNESKTFSLGPARCDVTGEHVIIRTLQADPALSRTMRGTNHRKTP
jgi:tRNA(Ile)-lysidine synthase